MSTSDNERRDANWWSFTIDAEKRKAKIRDDPRAGTVEINPEIDGRRLLSYHTYLRLDRLLSAQIPSSFVPDERCFIVTHQLFELVFRQMIFDLCVIVETLEGLLALPVDDFRHLVLAGGKSAGDEGTGDYWQPALTASARIRHSSLRLVPDIMGYLAMEETFSNTEFSAKFRDNLPPASGFQSAQLRLIQRALGKSGLFSVRMFPADTYLRFYLGADDAQIRRRIRESEDAGLVTVVDSLILREDSAVATPPADSPLAPAAQVDDLVHKVLQRLTCLKEVDDARRSWQPCRMLSIPSEETSLHGVAESFRQRLTEAIEAIRKKKNLPPALDEDEKEAVTRRAEVFRRDWVGAVEEENSRRRSYAAACEAARFLCAGTERSFLAQIIDSLIEADDALSGGFLRSHEKMVERRLGRVAGTAGGGAPFLEFSRSLIGHFPGFVAARSAPRNTAGA